jgi:nicotinamidase-related amidase
MDEKDEPRAPFRDRPRGGAALLILDMISRFDFEDGDALREEALAAARVIADLKRCMAVRGRPIIHVNDNFGFWHSERAKLVEHARQEPNSVLDLIEPGKEDYFIIKPQFSGFYATNLPVLLPKLGVDRLILTGMATEVCVLFTAADAHMRDLALWIPADAVASADPARGRAALDIMAHALHAETRPTRECSIEDWLAALDAADEES